jgi:hypothetical protein
MGQQKLLRVQISTIVLRSAHLKCSTSRLIWPEEAASLIVDEATTAILSDDCAFRPTERAFVDHTLAYQFVSQRLSFSSNR